MRWQSSTLRAKGIEAERIVGGVERRVGPTRRRRARRALGRIEQGQRLAGAADGGLADLVGMGEGGGLAGDAAQAEAGLRC